jgi:hypothetical protein
LSYTVNYPQQSIKGALLELMRESALDANRPRVNPTDAKKAGYKPIKLNGAVGLSVLQLAERLTKKLGRNVPAHDVTHALYDLRAQQLVDFRESKNQAQLRRMKQSNGSGGSPTKYGGGVPVWIKVTKKTMEMEPERLLADIKRDERWQRVDDHQIVHDLLDEARENAVAEEAEASAALDMGGGAITAVHPPVGDDESTGQEAEAILREAEASVALDHDEREGTHYLGDGHPHGEATVEASTAPELPVTAIGPIRLPLSKFDLDPYPLIRQLVFAEDNVKFAASLLRAAGQDEVADLAEGELKKRTPLELEVIELVKGLG